MVKFFKKFFEKNVKKLSKIKPIGDDLEVLCYLKAL